MKALTLHQPWASLVAVGAKTIETRSWGTKYRGRLAIHAAKRPLGTGALFVGDPTAPGGGYTNVTGEPVAEGRQAMMHGSGLLVCPLGAVIATCDLVDVVPIVDADDDDAMPWEDSPYPRLTSNPATDENFPDGMLNLYHPTLGNPVDPDLGRLLPASEASFGDFSPGRFAWLLDNIAPTTERCPACWGHPFYVCASDLPAGAVCGVCARESHRFTTPRSHDLLAGCPCCAADHTARGCWTCDGKGSCDPIPARGRQGLWEWTEGDAS